MQRLEQTSKKGTQAVNVSDWLSFLMFDVAGYLVFSVDFHCLENSTFHPCFNSLFGLLRDMAMLHVVMAMGLSKLVHILANSSFLRGIALSKGFADENLSARLKKRIARQGYD